MTRWRLLGALTFLVACEGIDERDGRPADAGPTGTDAGAADASARDAAVTDAGEGDAGAFDAGPVDPGPPASCGTTPFADWVVPLDPGPTSTQIHVNVTYDGEGLWVAYTLPAADGSGQFRTWAVRIACNGAHWVEPFMVTTSTAGNDIDPGVAVSGDTVMIVWQRDTGAFPNNLETLFRRFTRAGAPLDPTERPLELRRRGRPVAGNVWMPQIEALPGGGFAIVGAWSHEEASAFQVFAIRMTASGTTAGDALDVAPNPEQTQLFPAVAAEEDAALWVGWEEGVAEDARAVYTRLPVTSSVASGTITPVDLRSGGAFMGVDPDGGAFVALHAETGSGVDVLLSSTSTSTPADALSSGRAGAVDHSPGFAFSGPGRGALTWYRSIRGVQNDIYVRAFDTSVDGSLSGTPPMRLPLASPAAPYGPAITHVLDDWFFVAWQEGANPDFRIMGRFLELPPP